MQSRMRKMQDYQIGDAVHEGRYYAGEVAAVAEHPDKPTTGYLLLVNDKEEYTIYRGQFDCHSSLTLTRNIPKAVALYFSEIILGTKQPEKSIVRRAKKFPVITENKPAEWAETPKPLQEAETEDEPEKTKAPYFDFV